MAIEFVGNTLSDFFADASGGSLTSVTSTNIRDSALCANELAVAIQGGNSSPFSIVLDSAAVDCWIHCRVDFNGIGSNAAGGDWLKVYDASDNEIAIIDFTSDDLRAQAVGDSTVNGTTIENWPNDGMTLDVHVVVNGSTDITVSFYKDGSLLSEAVAANTGAKGGAKTITFTNFDLTFNNQTNYYSEFIVTSGGESTIGWRLGCLEPDGTGNHTDFEGDYVELSDDDLATAAATGTNGDRVSSTVTYGGPSTSGGIRAVIAKCVATKGDSGPGTLKQFLRISATNYDGSGEALTINNMAYMEEWATNPATASAWQSSDLTGIEVGVEASA